MGDEGRLELANRGWGREAGLPAMVASLPFESRAARNGGTLTLRLRYITHL